MTWDTHFDTGKWPATLGSLHVDGPPPMSGRFQAPARPHSRYPIKTLSGRQTFSSRICPARYFLRSIIRHRFHPAHRRRPKCTHFFPKMLAPPASFRRGWRPCLSRGKRLFQVSEPSFGYSGCGPYRLQYGELAVCEWHSCVAAARCCWVQECAVAGAYSDSGGPQRDSRAGAMQVSISESPVRFAASRCSWSAAASLRAHPAKRVGHFCFFLSRVTGQSRRSAKLGRPDVPHDSCQQQLYGTA